MKLFPRLLPVLIVIFSITACVPVPPSQPTRQQQLAETGLFGRHTIKGVTVESGLTGEINGGFFLFSGGIHGEINSTTSYVIRWYPTSNGFFDTTLPRSLFHINILESQVQPEIEFIFRQSWLTDSPNPFTDLSLDPESYFGDQITLYTEGAKKNLNGFLKPDNLDVVEIYISPKDLAPHDPPQIP